jgi:DNA ligase-1
MLCQPLEEKRLLKWNVPEILVQPKLDGERCRAYCDQRRRKWILVSSEGNEFEFLDHIQEQLIHLPRSFHFDGELYIHGQDFSTIHSIASRKKQAHPDAWMLEFHIFDYLSDEPAGLRSGKLRMQIDTTGLESIRLVHTLAVDASMDAVVHYLDLFTAGGYEGIIVRHPGAPYELRRSPYVMKFKPRKSDIYRIVDTLEEISINGTPKNALGALVCVGPEGNTFRVGTGFTREERTALWQERDSLPGQYVEILYQHLTRAQVPRSSVYKSIIISDGED